MRPLAGADDDAGGAQPVVAAALGLGVDKLQARVGGDQTRELPLQRARIGSAAADPATGAATPGNTPMPGGSDTPLKAQAQSTASSEPAPPKRKSRFGP